MKNRRKIVSVITALTMTALILSGCEEFEESDTAIDTHNTQVVGASLAGNQPTPTDINYSLERYNLIRRAYWVNGQREKAINLVSEVEKPLGYITLFSSAGAVLNQLIVDGKVTSLNSYLTPDSEFFEQGLNNSGGTYDEPNNWLPDVDGAYGSNDAGIFFFTPDGKYLEYTGDYLYSDIPFEAKEPVLKVATDDAAYSKESDK